MAIYAHLDSNNVVTNTIVADSLEIAEMVTNSICVEITEGGIGWTYDEKKKTFTAPKSE